MDYMKATSGPEGDKGSTQSTARSRYEALAAERRPYLERARECSRLTIPALLPPEGHTGASKLYRPYQSTGADGINNISAKLLMALFPPGTPFFKLTINDFVLEQLAQNAPEGEDPRGAFEAALGKIERAVVGKMEEEGVRSTLFETIIHLAFGGNSMLHCLDDGNLKFFPLSRYVLCRDNDDNVLEIVTKECISKDALPDNVKEIVAKAPESNSEATSGSTKEYAIYTWVYREGNKWKVHQEVCDTLIPGSEGTWPLDKCAFIPLRWTKVSGEHYGRGRCEEYLGDLYSLEALTKAIVEFAAAASKIVGLVDEGGITSKKELAEAPSGAIIDGNAKDVTFLQVDKGQDFTVTNAVRAEKKADLERAFLMASSVQRQAERVTAEEIRVMVNELEQGLGGVYSILSKEFQRPLVIRLMHVMSKGSGTNKIPSLPKGTVSPQIVTGLDGLGRNTDMLRLDALISGTAQQFGPEAVAEHINVGAYMSRRAASLGIDVNGLIRSDAEIQAQRQQAMLAQTAQKLGGPAIKAVSDNMLASRGQPSGSPETPLESLQQTQ